MTFRTETFTAPAHWACAIINDDTSGIESEEEVRDISLVEEYFTQGGGRIADCEEIGFCHDSDVRFVSGVSRESKLAGDICSFTVLFKEEEK